VCGDTESAETLDVVHDIARFARQWIRRSRHVQCHIVTAVRADLDAVDAEHS
jgi:hypothetical protein